jgi:hypothetical protein
MVGVLLLWPLVGWADCDYVLHCDSSGRCWYEMVCDFNEPPKPNIPDPIQQPPEPGCRYVWKVEVNQWVMVCR